MMKEVNIEMGAAGAADSRAATVKGAVVGNLALKRP